MTNRIRVTSRTQRRYAGGCKIVAPIERGQAIYIPSPNASLPEPPKGYRLCSGAGIVTDGDAHDCYLLSDAIEEMVANPAERSVVVYAQRFGDGELFEEFVFARWDEQAGEWLDWQKC